MIRSLARSLVYIFHFIVLFYSSQATPPPQPSLYNTHTTPLNPLLSALTHVHLSLRPLIFQPGYPTSPTFFQHTQLNMATSTDLMYVTVSFIMQSS